MAMRRAIFVVAILGCSMVAQAQRPAVGSLDPRDTAVRTILAGFWGNAKDIDGQLIEPTSAKDRETVPVSKAAAYRAIEAGNISGLAQWCGLDWEPHYFSLTKAARRMKMVDKQVAFLSVLHGAGQGAVTNAMKGKACSAGERARAESLLLESLRSGLPADAAQPW